VPPTRNRTIAEHLACVADAVRDEEVDEVKREVSGYERPDSKQADAE
jgi:hypothetical protein